MYIKKHLPENDWIVVSSPEDGAKREEAVSIFVEIENVSIDIYL